VEIAERVLRATLCLETALARHGLIDAIPAAIDIAVPRGSTRPTLRAPCRLHQFDARTFDLERELVGWNYQQRRTGAAPVSAVAASPAGTARRRHSRGCGCHHPAILTARR
jgi:hypothetical protein